MVVGAVPVQAEVGAGDAQVPTFLCVWDDHLAAKVP